MRRTVFQPPVLVILVFLATTTFGILGYYWWNFSGRIDRLLNGEIFTRSAGIYAAPKTIRVGDTISAQTLIEHLKRAGYVEKSEQGESSRGRYIVDGTSLELQPSDHAVLDGRRMFPPLKVQFVRGGRSISAIFDSSSNARYERAQLEPELISSVTGRERAKRRVIGFDDLPDHLVQAILVTEDRTFFEHYGVNFRGIIRALVRRYDGDPDSPIARQGGSSITQQLVKNLLLTSERSLRRKLAEAYMSIIIETRLSKKEIFTLYCNQVYLGQHAGFSINGLGEAADAYFQKSVNQLTLDEAAFLAGLIRSPNRYNPHKDLNTATARRNQVLQSMVDVGSINYEQFSQAQASPLKVASMKGRVDVSDAPYFVDYAENQLAETIATQGVAQHLRIYTSVDMDLQRAAYAAVSKQVNALDKVLARRAEPGTVQAALVAMDAKTGEIVAMVGGRDYAKSQLNRATDAFRQPGSVFKPFVYATALNTAYDAIFRVITPATLYLDEPKTFTYDNQEYSPGNFGDQYSNKPVTVRDALVKSLNVVTVEVAMDVTIGRVMNLAAKGGLPRVKRAYPSMALGASEATPLQIASAYTAFAANGSRVTPTAITRVTTGSGATIASVKTEKNEVVRPEVAYLMTDLLKDVVNRGTAARLGGRGFKNVPGKIGIAGKTGTSRDGWFAGYTPNLVCVVWVGFDDGSQLGLTGADSALPIWADFMNAALASHPEWNGDWSRPEGIEQAEIDIRTGSLATDQTASEYRRAELFISGTIPRSVIPPDESEYGDESEEVDSQENELTLPDLLPTPLRRPDERIAPQEDPASTRLSGTITLDVDPTTGLIADPNVCPVIRTKTFVIGQEPRKYCGPEFHPQRSRQDPSTLTRPRTISP